MNRTFRQAAAFTLAIAGAFSAHAADGWHPVIGGAVTFGGDTVATVTYTDGDSQDIKAGGVVHFYGGAELQSGAFALQTTVGYHVDSSNASNGTVKFSRVPLEMLGLWSLNDQVRVGGGLRKATSAKIRGTGAASGLGSHSLDGNVGLVLQAEYLFGDGKLATYVRYVSESYDLGNTSFSGDHLGLGLSYRF